jgi:hypothetical protein
MMSTSNYARAEFGVAASNIAGNIDVLLPQLAARGAEVAVAGNAIHDKVIELRKLGVELQEDTAEIVKPRAFDKLAEEIKAILPQLKGHGAQVEAVALAISGFCKQLLTVHAQHLHVTDGGEDAPFVAVPHVNNGVGGAPYNTGTALEVSEADASDIDPIPSPAGDGKV